MRVRSRSWEFDLARAPAEYWSLLADTARYNEAMGVPRHTVRDELQADGGLRFFGEMRVGPFTLAWEDLPPNWVTNAWQEHVRRFSRGPFASLAAQLHMTPRGAGTHLTYTLSVQPNGLASALFCRVFLERSGRGFVRVVAGARRFVESGAAQPFEYQPPPPRPAVRERVAALVQRMERTPYAHGLAARLARHLLEAQEVDLSNVRPIALARQWGVAERDCVELALCAARSGLLEARWQLLCPRCRVAKSGVASLEQLPAEAHCSTCNIHFDRDYARNVELAFSPAVNVRPVERGEFCWLGPMNTPHISAQLTLAAGEQRRVEVPLASGSYRLRTLEAGAEAPFEWHGEGFPPLRVSDDAAEAPAADLLPGALVNTASRPRTLIVEHREWLRDVLTAHRVTTVQAFRDLFSADVLRPGDDVAVEHVTFMFTDLVGSTALYQRLGDAPAYHRVREHLALLTGIVRAHDGAIVKSRGDGIHAAFVEPADALRAALHMQRALAEAADRQAAGGISMRIGLHAGPSIAVTIDGRLDYYGTTVNTAARLEGQGAGGDVVLSEMLAGDPAITELLGDVEPERLAVDLKGLTGRHAVYRLDAEHTLMLARRLAVGEQRIAGPATDALEASPPRP